MDLGNESQRKGCLGVGGSRKAQSLTASPVVSFVVARYIERAGI